MATCVVSLVPFLLRRLMRQGAGKAVWRRVCCGVGCGSGAWKACSKAALLSVVSCLLRRRMRQRGQGKLVGVVSAAVPNAAAAAEKRLPHCLLRRPRQRG